MAITIKTCAQVKFTFVVLMLLFIAEGSCLQCYKCFSTSKECYNGDPECLSILNCSSKNEVCATFQYEITDDSNLSYITTIRGCQPIIKEGICSQLMKTKTSKKFVQKGVMCTTCETDLCNSSMENSMSLIALPVIILAILKI